MSTRILHGDCRVVLRNLPDGSVQCVVTSPPYLGLRDYGEDGQIGRESTLAEYVATLVDVFREIRRVLRDDGVVWLNLGDSYTTQGGAGTQGVGGVRADRTHTAAGSSAKGVPGGMKPKDLMMIPARVAIALVDDGWWLRSDVVWAKQNPMPESVRDRPTSAHEHVFLLTKSERYYYDNEAVREPYAEATIGRLTQATFDQQTSGHKDPGTGNRSARRALVNMKSRLPQAPQLEDSPGSYSGSGRNLRNVWTLSTKPFAGSHFATFPPELPETCIKAGTSERGACPACGAPWRRMVTKGAPDMAQRLASGADASGGYSGQSTKGHDAAGVQDASAVKARILEGMREKKSEWVQGCECPPAPPVPCMVLDPFGGAGTTALVADQLGRDCILIELNPDYIAMAKDRICRDASLLADVRVA